MYVSTDSSITAVNMNQLEFWSKKYVLEHVSRLLRFGVAEALLKAFL